MSLLAGVNIVMQWLDRPTMLNPIPGACQTITGGFRLEKPSQTMEPKH